MRAAILLALVACGFPEPSPHDPGGDAGDAGVDPGPGCADCRLLAVEPAIARAGDTIVLDGTFAANARVVFPGGATATPSSIGAHRATVVVPAGAGSGDLVVTHGTSTTEPLAFRTTSFALGVGPFRAFDDQTNGARQLATLTRPRLVHAGVVIGHAVYVIGGSDGATRLASVERARINADSSLGRFATVPGVALAQPRQEHEAVVIGHSVYVLGGFVGGDAMPTDTVERASIGADGSLGTFALVPGVHLAERLTGMRAVVIGDALYVVGGRTSSDDAGATAAVSSVERAQIGLDGTLGPFEIVATTALATPRENHALVVAGKTLLAIGGGGTSGRGTPLGSVEAAPIHDDGTLGAFAVLPGTLAKPRLAHKAFAVGGAVYVVAGLAAGNQNLATVERAAIGSDGLPGPFALAGTMPSGRLFAPLVRVRDELYVIGGSTVGDGAGVIATVAHASLDAGGTLELAGHSPATLLQTRDRARVAVIGDFLYVISGAHIEGANGGPVSAIERAPIAADGTLGAFEPAGTLVKGRMEPGLAITTDFVYVFAGAGGGDGPFFDDVERAPIRDDGTLGDFALVPGRNLATARNTFATLVLGNNVYVLGGYNATPPLASIERAAIGPDGSLGAFANGGTLATGRNADTAVVLGGFAYMIGGVSGAPAPTGSIDRAPIAADGTLGTFALVPGSLTTARFDYGLVVAGTGLHVIGGSGAFVGTNDLASIERADIAPDGTLGPMSTGSALPDTRGCPVGVRLGDHAYAIGGDTTDHDTTATIEQALLR